MKRLTDRWSQRGSMLLEGLIAILIFSMGILALVGMQAVAIKNTADAKYRADAAFLANQIIGRMWADNPLNLASYAHNPTGPICNFTVAASANANVIAWLGASGTQGTVIDSLPGATSALQQIIIGANNLVTVSVCWQAPNQAVPNNHVVVAQING